MFYLFHKFVKDDRNEIPLELGPTLLDRIRDVLVITVELPELENPSEEDLLTEAIKKPGIFDSQLYLFEVVGLLVSLHFKSVENATSLLLSFVQPLLDDLQTNLQAIKSAQDVVQILKVHHIVMALGDIARGFPDYPDPVPEHYVPPPIPVFRQMTQAIVVSLEAMNVFKPVRDAARFAFARMVATTGAHIIDFIPALMSSLLSHFEQTELVDFVNFLSQLMHKLNAQISDVLVQLVMPLHARTMELLSAPITGTDDRVVHTDTKKGYLTFLNNVLTNRLHGILLSDGGSYSLARTQGSDRFTFRKQDTIRSSVRKCYRLCRGYLRTVRSTPRVYLPRPLRLYLGPSQPRACQWRSSPIIARVRHVHL